MILNLLKPLLPHDDVGNLQRGKLLLHNAQARLLPWRPKVNGGLFVNSTSDASFHEKQHPNRTNLTFWRCTSLETTSDHSIVSKPSSERMPSWSSQDFPMGFTILLQMDLVHKLLSWQVDWIFPPTQDAIEKPPGWHVIFRIGESL